MARRPTGVRGEHIPGAHWVDLEQHLSAPPAPAAATRCRIRPGSRPRCGPSAYARTGRWWPTTPTSSQAAARLWWLLTDAGHPAVRVLNGGLAAWRAAGLATESGPSPATAPGDFVARPGRARPADRARTSPPAWPATGGCGWSTSGRPSATRARRSRSIRWPGTFPARSTCPSTANLDADGRFLDAAAIVRRVTPRPGSAPRPSLYCGSGVTAAHSLLALESAGLTGAIYPGSWSEWITDPRPTGRHRVSVSAWGRRT